MWTCVDRDGTLLDSDKSVWFQGRAGWMFATMFNTVEQNPLWLEVAQSCVDFLDRCAAPIDHAEGTPNLSHLLSRRNGEAVPKLYFTVTRDAKPLRMR
ncbi:MAG: hypothetical protein RL069_1187, partial [Planctomycetota bacterium]